MEYENDIEIIPKRRKVVLKSQKFESYGWILITIRALRKTFCRIEFFLTIFLSTTKTPESAKKNYQNNSILDQISISKKKIRIFLSRFRTHVTYKNFNYWFKVISVSFFSTNFRILLKFVSRVSQDLLVDFL